MKKFICLALILIFTASLLIGCKTAGVQSPAGTDQQPSVTQRPLPTATAIPPSTAIYDVEIRLQQTMTITKWTEKSLRCSYSVDREVYSPGDVVSASVRVMNLSSGIEYVGAPEDQFGVALLCASSANYVIMSEERVFTDDATERELAPGEVVIWTFEFVIPQDAPDDTYWLEFSVFDMQVRFDTKAAEEDRNLLVLADLPEDVQLRMIGEYEYNTKIYQKHKYRIPVYGAFDGVYAYIYTIGYTNGFPNLEIVNGLEFRYADGIRMTVYSETDGCFYLSEAFEGGILTAEQLQEVYENYMYLKKD